MAVVNRMNSDWKRSKGATFTSATRSTASGRRPGRRLRHQRRDRLASLPARAPRRLSPDLFLYALLGRFGGYYPGYSSLPAKIPNCLTWVVLKGHTNKPAGEVTLRSPTRASGPRSTSTISRKAATASGDDLKAVVERRRLARRLAAT